MTCTLGDWLHERPFHLALSAGFFGFFSHAGLLAALEDAGLRPAGVTGASAGALSGGLWAAGLDADTLRDELASLRRAHFWDPGPGAGLLRGRLMRRKLESILPTARFDGTRVPFAASVFDLLSRSTRVVREGDLAAAICASSALPGLFQPVWIRGRPCIDGGVLDRPAHAGLPPSERALYHHLASHSPWRWYAPQVPPRPDTLAIVLRELPRSGPFRLDVGMVALDQARRRAKRLLDAPVPEGGDGVMMD